MHQKHTSVQHYVRAHAHAVQGRLADTKGLSALISKHTILLSCKLWSNYVSTARDQGQCSCSPVPEYFREGSTCPSGSP